MVKLSFDDTQWLDLVTKLEDGQTALAISLSDIQSELANMASLLSESLIVLKQIRDNTEP